MILNHLQHLKTSIEDDVRAVFKFHVSLGRGGYHSIPRQIFCYVDYLGSLTYGRNDTQNAVKFIENYFPRKYRRVGQLIYHMWRHGTVHEYDPKILRKNQMHLIWRSVLDKNEAREHLKTMGKQLKEHKNLFYFTINVDELLNDLILAINKLIEQIKKNKTLESKLIKNYNLTKATQDVLLLVDNKLIVRTQFENCISKRPYKLLL